MWLFLAFILVPIIEIMLFIELGGAIGTAATLAIIVATALLGSYLMRKQGLAQLSKLQDGFGSGNPLEPIAHGALILVAGVLLLTPGFFTDAFGLSLLIPAVRKLIILWLGRNFTEIRFSSRGPNRDMEGDIIDGDYSHAPPNRAEREKDRLN